jgi:hypothetical protein
MLFPELEKNNKEVLLFNILKELEFSAKKDFLKTIAQKFTSNITVQIERARNQRTANNADGAKAGENLYNQTKADLNQMKNIFGVWTFTYYSIADKVANEILQCSIEYFNDRQKEEKNINYINIATAIANKAQSIAVETKVKDRIEENLQTMNEWKLYGICFFCNKEAPYIDGSYKIKIYTDIHRRYYPQTSQRGVEYKILEIAVPRCKNCLQIHHKGSRSWVMTVFTIIGAIISMSLGHDMFVSLLGGGFVGLIIGYIISSIIRSIMISKAGIKKQSEGKNFELIKQRLKEGGTLSKPEA